MGNEKPRHFKLHENKEGSETNGQMVDRILKSKNIKNFYHMHYPKIEGNKSSHFRPIRDTILIQGVLFKNLLISIISFLLQIVLSFVLYRFVFSNNGVYPIYFDIEISIIISFFSMLILSLIAGILIFQPKYPFKMIFRTTLYQIILLVGYLIGEIIFTRLLGINVALSYFISGVILILPLFSLIKGIGLVYDYQNS